MEYHLAIKNNEVLIHAKTQKNLENIIPCKELVTGTSLVVQWLRPCTPRVPFLVREPAPTCCN